MIKSAAKPCARARRPLALAILVFAMLAGAAAQAEEAVSRVEIEGTSFRLTLADGRMISGPALVGMTLTLADDGGRRLALRIDAVRSDPKDPDNEITLYAFSVADAATGTWRNACGADPDGQRLGFPLAQPGGGFGFTCTAGALGKCVRFGYKPWRAARSGVAMRDLYEACVHLVRADYCGDGTPHTRNGTPIDIYDRVGIQRDEAPAGMRFEAAWGPKGAVCVARTRIPAIVGLDQLLAECPRLRAAPSGADCTEAAPGALLYDKSY
jgi:hypothetical protein